MITIISSTNRRISKTRYISHFVHEYLKDKADVKLFDLIDFPVDAYHPDMYEKETQSESLYKIQKEYMVPAEKYIFLIPEYNGDSPGILKLFIDACSARDYKATFGNKKALLIGVSDGRAGNLRGIESFTLILNFLGVTVYPMKQPISQVDGLLDGDKLTDEGTQKVITNLIDKFLDF